jgi:hypothetical protein
VQGQGRCAARHSTPNDDYYPSEVDEHAGYVELTGALTIVDVVVSAHRKMSLVEGREGAR